MDNNHLWEYRLKQLEEKVCEHDGMIEKNTEKINEHDKLLDRVGFKLDQISDNVMEVKTEIKTLISEKNKKTEDEASRPKKLAWEMIKAVALALVGALMVLLLK